MWLLHCQ
jgi:hypothetical protein